MIDRLTEVLETEPVLVYQAVAAILALGVVFGLALPVGAAAAIVTAIEAVVAVLVRRRVTPVAAARLPEGSFVEIYPNGR